MANIKISALPQVNTVLGTDVVPTVASSATSKITITDLANSLPQVSSSISASYALTASHALNVTSINTGSFITTGSNSITQNISGSLNITGSLIISGSIKTDQRSYADQFSYALRFEPYNGFYGIQSVDPNNREVTASAAISWWGSPNNASVASFGPGAIDRVYFSDQNFGQIGLISTAAFEYWAGSLKFIRHSAAGDTNAGKVAYNTLFTNNATLYDSEATTTTLTANGRVHVLGVTGSFLARDGVTLGTNIINRHHITGSVLSTGSFTQNGFVVLTQVSNSLNFADDTAAAAGGVPLGGLYRNGNVVAIRIV